MAHPDLAKDGKDTFLSLYNEYAKILRTWLVAYGIGGPVLFFTNEKLSQKIGGSGQTKLIVYLFLIGVACQVLLAFLNKWVNWVIFAYSDSSKTPWICNKCDWISEQFWIDILLDLGAIVLFAFATMEVIFICA